jgi:DNA-binding CsgD family transcriptional regulator
MPLQAGSGKVSDPRPVISQATIAKWQSVVDLTARLVDVPSCLVMKTDPPDHAVLVSSDSAGNPYEVGQSFELNDKLYCYSVLTNRGELVVEDAQAEPQWCDNQDLEHGMSFYIGYPLLWPDGTPFGTICVLDRRENAKALLHRALLKEFCTLIEGDLALLTEIDRRERLEAELKRTLEGLEARVAERTHDLAEANTALRVLLSQVEASRLEFEGQILRQIKGLVLPHVAKLRHCQASGEAARAYLDLLDANLVKITSSFASRLVNAFECLTPTEAEIAQMVMAGKSTKDIALALSRERSTIDFHRNNIRRKLGLNRRDRNLRSHLLSMQ